MNDEEKILCDVCGIDVMDKKIHPFEKSFHVVELTRAGFKHNLCHMCSLYIQHYSRFILFILKIAYRNFDIIGMRDPQLKEIKDYEKQEKEKISSLDFPKQNKDWVARQE